MKHAIPIAAGIADSAGVAGDIAQSQYKTETAADIVPFSRQSVPEVFDIVHIVSQNLPTKAARAHFVEKITPELKRLHDAHANRLPVPSTPHLRRLVGAVKTLERLNPAIPLDGEPWVTTNPIAWTIHQDERTFVNAILRRYGYEEIRAKGFRATALETILATMTDPSDRNAVREEIVRTLILNGTRDEYRGVTRQQLLEQHQAYSDVFRRRDEVDALLGIEGMKNRPDALECLYEAIDHWEKGINLHRSRGEEKLRIVWRDADDTGTAAGWYWRTFGTENGMPYEDAENGPFDTEEDVLHDVILRVDLSGLQPPNPPSTQTWTAPDGTEYLFDHIGGIDYAAQLLEDGREVAAFEDGLTTRYTAFDAVDNNPAWDDVDIRVISPGTPQADDILVDADDDD